jgi:hypothetical protein
MPSFLDYFAEQKSQLYLDVFPVKHTTLATSLVSTLIKAEIVENQNMLTYPWAVEFEICTSGFLGFACLNHLQDPHS